MNNKPELRDLPRITDPRGNLSFIEELNHVPFQIKRTYWIYDVPGGSVRGSHALKTTCEFIVALCGSFEVELFDGEQKQRYLLNRSYYGLYIPQMIWRSLDNFSTNALCMVIASQEFNEKEYIRELEEFKKTSHDFIK